MADERDPRLKALEQMSQDQDLTDRILDYMDRMGAASRSGIYEAQQFDPENPMAAPRAFMEQLGRPSAEAPTGADIAERTGIENPYALGTIATIADLTDPTPFGKLGSLAKGAKGAAMMGALGKVASKADEASDVAKAIKGMGKESRISAKAGDISFPARHEAEARKVQEILEQQGKIPEGSMLQLGERQPIQAMEHMAGKPAGTPKAALSKEDLLQTLEDFPQLRKQKRFSGKL